MADIHKILNGCCDETTIEVIEPCEDEIPTSLGVVKASFIANQNNNNVVSDITPIFICCDGDRDITLNFQTPTLTNIPITLTPSVQTTNQNTIQLSVAYDSNHNNAKLPNTYNFRVPGTICGKEVFLDFEINITCSENLPSLLNEYVVSTIKLSDTNTHTRTVTIDLSSTACCSDVTEVSNLIMAPLPTNNYITFTSSLSNGVITITYTFTETTIDGQPLNQIINLFHNGSISLCGQPREINIKIPYMLDRFLDTNVTGTSNTLTCNNFDNA